MASICAPLLLAASCAAQAIAPAGGPAAGAGDGPAQARPDAEAVRRRTADNRKAALNRLADAGTYDLSEILTLSLRQQAIHAEFHPPQRLKDMASGRAVRIGIRGHGGTWEFSLRRDANTDSTSPYAALTRYDFDATLDPARLEVAAVHLRDDRLTIRGSRGGGRVTTVLLIVQRGPDPLMSIALTAQRGRLQNVRSMYELRRQQPQIVREHLALVLRQFDADHLLAPGPTDYYRAFDQIPAAPEVMQQVRDLLPRLETEPFEAREDASDELDALGRAGVLAVLRMDRTGLGAEAQLRLEAHLARHAHWPEQPPAAALADADFLLEAMDFDDPAVRQAAARALQALIGEPVEIDPSLDGEARRAALRSLRQRILPAADAAPPPAPF